MRNFLETINIVGALLVSRCGEILHYSIPDILKYCDHLLIVMDNEDDETRAIVEGYKKKFPDIIRVHPSGFPRATKEQEEKKEGLFRRFKPLQPYIRDVIFQVLREDKKWRADILLWPDSDECFNVDFPSILEEFWKSSKKGLYCKHVSVFEKMDILIRKSQPPDVIAYKYDPNMSALPYRRWQIYKPLTKDDLFQSKHTRIHLAYLTLKKREWRNNTWRSDVFSERDGEMWFLGKDAREVTSQEYFDILKKKKPDSSIKEYLKKQNGNRK